MGQGEKVKYVDRGSRFEMIGTKKECYISDHKDTCLYRLTVGDKVFLIHKELLPLIATPAP